MLRADPAGSTPGGKETVVTGLGILLIVLGLGSLVLPMFNIQFTLMTFIEDSQPWAGIVVALIGVVLAAIPIMRARQAALAGPASAAPGTTAPVPASAGAAAPPPAGGPPDDDSASAETTTPGDSTRP
jgi:hypothetical protein